MYGTITIIYQLNYYYNNQLYNKDNMQVTGYLYFMYIFSSTIIQVFKYKINGISYF